MAEKKEDILFENNDFLLKVKIQKEGKEVTKEVKLRPYSFSVQLKLMESGLINELMQVQKKFNTGKEVKPEDIDFTQMGKLLRLAIQIIHEMLPREIKITKSIEELTDEVLEGEPLRFTTWLMSQFGRTNAFLAQAPQKEGAVEQG